MRQLLNPLYDTNHMICPFLQLTCTPRHFLRNFLLLFFPNYESDEHEGSWKKIKIKTSMFSHTHNHTVDPNLSTLTFDLPCSRWFCPRLWAPPTWPRGGPPWSRRTGWSSWSAFGWSGVSWSPPHSWSPPPDGHSRAPESPLQGTSPAGWPTKEKIQP